MLMLIYSPPHIVSKPSIKHCMVTVSENIHVVATHAWLQAKDMLLPDEVLRIPTSPCMNKNCTKNLRNLTILSIVST